jgi:competence protein ComEA
MKPWQTMTFGILIGLLASGLILLITSPKQGDPIALSPPPTPTNTQQPKPTDTLSPITVQISGEIIDPGVYTLGDSSRLSDLITLAGGLTKNADATRINYAAILNDGDFIYIAGEEEILPSISRDTTINLPTEESDAFIYPLNLNEATQEALESLPGIGEVKAAAIIAYRDLIGGFTTVDELIYVNGIGPATLDSIRDYLVIEP